MGERGQQEKNADTPIAVRLRARTTERVPRYKESTGERRRSSKKGKNESRKSGETKQVVKTKTQSPPPANTTPGPPAISKENMDDLYKHLSDFHGNTEKSMREMVESCKAEINGNLNEKVNSITDSMKGIKEEMTRIESVFENKIANMQDSFKLLETKVDSAASEIKRVERCAHEN